MLIIMPDDQIMICLVKIRGMLNRVKTNHSQNTEPRKSDLIVQRIKLHIGCKHDVKMTLPSVTLSFQLKWQLLRPYEEPFPITGYTDPYSIVKDDHSSFLTVQKFSYKNEGTYQCMNIGKMNQSTSVALKVSSRYQCVK